MNQEQKDIMVSFINSLVEGNKLLLESLNKMSPADQIEYLPKVKNQLEATQLLIDHAKLISG